MRNDHEYPEDEIDLRSLVAFLVNWRKLILGTSLIGMILAVIIVIMANTYTSRSYEATSTIKLGEFYWGQSHLGYPPWEKQEIRRRLFNEKQIEETLLNNEHLSSMVTELSLSTSPEELRKKIEIRIDKSNGIVFLKISDRSRKDLQRICQQFHDAALRYMKDELSKKLWAVHGDLKRLEEKADRLSHKIAEAEELIAELGSSTASASSIDALRDEIIVTLALSDYENQLADMEWERLKLKEILRAAQPREVQRPTVGARKKIKFIPTMAIFGLFGLICGVLAAFLKEHRHKAWTKQKR